MKKIQLLFVLTIISYSFNASAQLPEQSKTALSPNAASLGLYGNIPVSYYTGTPVISIPLYDIKVSDFVLPISLDYHASGVQVDQRAGWTGVNWTLFAGGAITRSINDIPDEYNNSMYHLGSNAGFFFRYNVLNTTSWNQRTYLRSIAQSDDGLFRDTAPDEFSFSFPGYNGKFYLDHTRNWVVQCDKPVKVEFDGIFFEIPFSKLGTQAVNYGYSPCFSGFTITTDDGTKYQFGKDINAIDFSIDFFLQKYDEWLATAWYLTKIILPNTHEINFTYERNEFINQMYIAMHYNLETKVEYKGIFIQPSCSSWSYKSIEKCYEGKLISPVYLKEITTDNAVVTFTKSLSNELKYAQSVYIEKYRDWSQVNLFGFLPILGSNKIEYPDCLDQLKWYKLDKITIQNKNETDTLKIINFGYNNSSSERLFLDSITESGKSPYSFSYFNRNSLPDYLANKSDHWGYFNNTLAPVDIKLKKVGFRYRIDTTYTYPKLREYYYFRDPNPNSDYVKHGILNKIVYPTGGYTEFEYEPHTYRKQLDTIRWNPCIILSSNQTAGGLRIKQIKNSATDQGPAQVVKEYYYVSDYLQNTTNDPVSSGVLGGQTQYLFMDYTTYAFNSEDVRWKKSVFSSISVLPACRNINGSHIGYTEVIEKNLDNSFTRYQFANFDNGYLDEPADAIIQQSRTPYEPYASKAFERGKLIVQEEYNADRKKIKSKSIVYEKSSVSNNYVRAMNARYLNVCPGTAVSYDEGTSFKIYTYSLRPVSEIDTIFEQNNDEIVNNIEYSYNSKNLLSSTDFTRSDGKKQTTKFVYPFEIKDGQDTTIMRKMTEKNILLNYIEKVIFYHSGIPSFGSVISGEYRKYGEIYPGIFRPQQIDILELQNPVSYSTIYPWIIIESYYLNGQLHHIYGNSVTMFGNSYLKPEIYYKYDNHGNIRESKPAGNNIPTTYLWGYNYQYPIAKVENATYDQVKNQIQGGQATIDAIAASDTLSASHQGIINGLRTALFNAQVTTYTYKPLVGMLTATDPRGIVIYYDYDSFGRLKEVYYYEGGNKRKVETYDYHYR